MAEKKKKQNPSQIMSPATSSVQQGTCARSTSPRLPACDNDISSAVRLAKATGEVGCRVSSRVLLAATAATAARSNNQELPHLHLFVLKSSKVVIHSAHL
jgi:hypothetical protein